LSGFLITTLLVSEKKKNGCINLYKFMGRRILRLFPAYYFYIGIISLVIYLGFGTLREIGGWEPSMIVASLWGYFNNFIPRGGFWEYDSLLIHLWSLALEEQYYLIWPLLLVGVLRLKNVLFIPTLIILLLLIIRFMGADLDYDDKLHTRGIALFIGSYMSLVCFKLDGVTETLKNHKNLIIIVLMGILLTVSVGKLYGMIGDSELRQTPVLLLDVFFAFMIAAIWYGNDGGGSILSMPLLVYIGKISYGIYLYHMACHFIVWDFWYLTFSELPNYVNYFIRLSTYLLMSVGLASLSYRYLEMPFLRLKEGVR